VVQGEGDEVAVAVRLVVEPGVEALQRAPDAAARRPLVQRRVAPVGDSIGSSVNEMYRLTSTEVGDRQRERAGTTSPATPGMKATGMKMATIEKGRAADREADLRGAAAGGGDAVGAVLQVPHDVLAHDDGVVDQHADGQRDASSVMKFSVKPHSQTAMKAVRRRSAGSGP
jgi:hypothetical protein